MKQLQTTNHHNTSHVQAAIDAGFTLGAAEVDVNKLSADAVPFITSRGELVLTSVEKFGAAPVRVRGTIIAESPSGFADYVNRYKTADTIIFVRRRNEFDLTAVLDYHRPGVVPAFTPGSIVPTEPGELVTLPATGSVTGAQPGEHRAFVKAAFTPEWAEWRAIDGVSMNQTKFAEFLEDHLDNIASPDGALLLEIAQNFRIKKDVTFQSNVRLSNGSVQLTYNEDVQGASSTGQVVIPERFVLGIAPFEGNQPFRVDVRFRYRLESGGKLAVWIDILRREVVERGAFDEIVTAIKSAIGGENAPVYIEGKAPSSTDIWGS